MTVYLSRRAINRLFDMLMSAENQPWTEADLSVGRLAALDSALARPQAGIADMEMFPTLTLKAAALIQALVQNHPICRRE